MAQSSGARSNRITIEVGTSSIRVATILYLFHKLSPSSRETCTPMLPHVLSATSFPQVFFDLFFRHLWLWAKNGASHLNLYHISW